MRHNPGFGQHSSSGRRPEHRSVRIFEATLESKQERLVQVQPLALSALHQVRVVNRGYVRVGPKPVAKGVITVGFQNRAVRRVN